MTITKATQSKISTFFFILVSLILFRANTCSKSGEKSEENKTTSLLWEITGNGLAAPSYLYGTIHMLDKKDFFVRPEIDSAFNKAKQVVFEIKLDDMAALMSIQNEILLPQGKTIDALCSKDDFEKMKLFFSDSLQKDIASFNKQKPFTLIQAMTEKYIEGDMESFELHFLMKCMASQKPISGLETVQDQMGIFDSIPYTEQISWIVDWIDSSNQYEILFDALIDAYKIEDLELIAKLMTESSPELMKYEDAFLINRNNNWIPKIDSLIKLNPSFIAVGAGHLPGESGIITLLRKQGYILKPI